MVDICTYLRLVYMSVSGTSTMKLSFNNAGNSFFAGNISKMASLNQLNVESTEIESDGGQRIVCSSQKEMLDKFEEYKRETQSGWRCVNSNNLFGGYLI